MLRHHRHVGRLRYGPGTSAAPSRHRPITGAQNPSPVIDAVIVIFGAAVRPGGRPSTTLHRRVEAAAAFGMRFAAPLFVPTGGVGRFGPSEAAVMASLLEARGVPPGRILLEETGTDTLSSAGAVARLLRLARRHRAGVRGEQMYHVPRCVLLLRIFGVAARAAGPPWVTAGSRWMTRGYWWLREAAALPYDAALGCAHAPARTERKAVSGRCPRRRAGRPAPQ